MNITTHTFKWGQNNYTLETGRIANNTTASVFITMDNTQVLATLVRRENPEKGLSLSVNYIEKSYAAGKIPGGFLKREGRPTESERLKSISIERAIRPIFAPDYGDEVSITCTVLSSQKEVNPDMVAMLGAFAVLAISGLPITQTLGAVRLSYKDENYALNPDYKQLDNADLSMLLAGGEADILMLEFQANKISETLMLETITHGCDELQTVVAAIDKFAQEVATPMLDWQANPAEIDLESMQNQREEILSGQARTDGRDGDTVRNLEIEIDALKGSHGSALFNSGQTQALVSTTIGTKRDAQLIETLSNVERVQDFFLFHQNLPAFCTGEISTTTNPKHDEIEQGYLAKCAIAPCLPSVKTYVHTIRVVSEITQSNGASVMASVCGASLSLMDAGVPMKSPIAGVAMGVVVDTQSERFQILTDTLAQEEILSDVCLNVAGTSDGITAIKLQVNTQAIDHKMISLVLRKAYKARLHILGDMNKIICESKVDNNKTPQSSLMQIHKNKVSQLIGKSGVTIKKIIKTSGAHVEVSDSGVVKISAKNQEQFDHAKQMVKDATLSLEVGTTYDGKVTKILDFGAFVNLMPGQNGLLHVSEIVHERVDKVSDHLKVDQIVKVVVLSVENGRIKLSHKALDDKP